MENYDETEITLKTLRTKLQEAQQAEALAAERTNRIRMTMAEFEPEQLDEPSDKLQLQLPSYVANSGTPSPYDTEISTLEIDFSTTQNLRQKFFLVFEACDLKDKAISTTAVAQYLLDRNHSRSTLKNLKNSVYRTITDFEDHFEKLDAGIYRYKRELDKSVSLDEEFLPPETGTNELNMLQ